MSAAEELVRNAGRHAEGFEEAGLPAAPRMRVAVLACMDTRLNPYAILGLREGDAHLIRNAGGVVTADAIRSLAVSQRLLGTNEVILLHHTDCGMLGLDDDEFRRQIRQDTDIEPEWAAEGFDDVDDDVRQSIARIKTSPFIPHKEAIRGFVYDVETGRLEEIR